MKWDFNRDDYVQQIKEMGIHAYRWFMKLPFDQKVFTITGSLLVLVLFIAVLIPSRSIIKPVGKEVVEAYNLLQQCPTGIDLIDRVKKNSQKSYIYLTLGKSDDDNLRDYSGDEVKALTRSKFIHYEDTYFPESITVIANKNIIGSDPREVVKSLAFELENVLHAVKHPHGDFGRDSPRAYPTQKKVIQELGLDLRY